MFPRGMDVSLFTATWERRLIHEPEAISYVGGERSIHFSLCFARNWVDFCAFSLLDLGLHTGGALNTCTGIIARAGSEPASCFVASCWTLWLFVFHLRHILSYFVWLFWFGKMVRLLFFHSCPYRDAALSADFCFSFGYTVGGTLNLQSNSVY